MIDAAPAPEEPRAEPRRPSPGAGRALVLVPTPPPAAPAGLGRSHAAVAAAVALVMGLGLVAGTAAFGSRAPSARSAEAVAPPDPTLDALARLQGEVRSLKASLDGARAGADDARRGAEALRGLSRSLDTLRQDLDTAKQASTGALGQVSAKLDRLDRDPDARLVGAIAQLSARLDRVDRQIASAEATGSLPPPAARATPLPPRAAPPAAVAAPPPRPEPRAEPARAEPAHQAEVAVRSDIPARPAALAGWSLRDVYDGMALVEGRGGGLREIVPGQRVPGAGEVRSIERRGRGWVVVTSRGVIEADDRW